MLIMKIQTITILISLTLLIQGCMGGKESILPQDGPTMKQVYDGHFIGHPAHKKNKADRGAGKSAIAESQDVSEEKKELITRRYNDKENDLTGYTRTAHTEIEQIFPRLKNKTLTLYIFPHLSKLERHPVPGYSTGFTLYRQTEYALPGESVEGY